MYKKYSIIVIILCILSGCSGASKEVMEDDTVDRFSSEIPFATPEVIALHEANLAREYKIGPGDLIKINIWNRARISGEHLVGPYGNITLPMLGVFKIGGLSRETSASKITELYQIYYNEPITTVDIIKYMNNRVYVLGRVSNPGLVHFNNEGTLLEALAMAGGLPAAEKSVFLSKCYIIRGKNQIIWIDLLQLLQNVNTKLNIKLANNDIIYIPEYMDAAVFVMGEVRNPGSYSIRSYKFSVLDAINLAGGPTEDASAGAIRLIRDMKENEGVKKVNLNKMLAKGDLSQNYLLKDNDILYIPSKKIAGFNYFLRQIDPFLRTFISGMVVKEALDDE